jgi:hypothetical protein
MSLALVVWTPNADAMFRGDITKDKENSFFHKIAGQITTPSIFTRHLEKSGLPILLIARTRFESQTGSHQGPDCHLEFLPGR